MISAMTFSGKGEEMAKTTLPADLFGAKISSKLLAQAVRVYLANQRRSMASTKTRGDVVKTTAKMYKQKGTGRARHGSYSAPVFVGGGIAHGPTGEQNNTLKMPARMRRAAMIGALTEKARQKKVLVLGDLGKTANKTKQVAGMAEKMKVSGSNVLVVMGKGESQALRGWQNMPKVEMISVNQLTVYPLLRCEWLVITSEGLKEASELFSSKKAE